MNADFDTPIFDYFHPIAMIIDDRTKPIFNTEKYLFALFGIMISVTFSSRVCHMKSFITIASVIEVPGNKKGCPYETASYYDKKGFEKIVYSTTTLRIKFPLFEMIFSI